MDSLAHARRYLPVKEIVRRVKMSERSVRKHLIVLLNRGVLRRRAAPGGSRRVTYEYSLRPARDILAATRRDFTLTLSKLEAAVSRLAGARKRISPRTASSSRS